MNDFFLYACAIASFFTNKRANVFKMKELEIIIGYNNVQSQGDESAPNDKFSNILHKLESSCLVISLVDVHTHKK
jgi:hypothetical protein